MTKTKIKITPTYSEALILYARLYSSMTAKGKKAIETDLKNWGECLEIYKNKFQGKSKSINYLKGLYGNL
jgi:hypothetical protein